MLGAKILQYSVAQLLVSLLGFGGLLLLSRGYGVSGLGIIALALSFVGLFQYLTKLGFDMAHVKRISEGLDLRRGIGVYLTVKIVLTVLFAVAVVTVLNLTNLMGDELRQSPQRQVVLIIIVAMSFRALADVPIQTFAAQRRTLQQVFPLLAAAVVRVGGIVAAIVVGWGLVGVSVVYVAAEIVGLGVAAWLFRRYRISRPQANDFRRYAVFALPMLVVGVTASAEIHLDKILLGYFEGAGAVGEYFGAERLIAFLQLIATGIVTLYFPTISKQFALGQRELAHRMALSAERYSVIILAPIVVYVWLYAEPLMTLLGRDFVGAADALRFLTAASVVTIVTLPFSEQIAAADRPGLKMWLSVVLRVSTLR